MKAILHINTTPSEGGAAAVMQQCRQLMAQRNFNVPLLTGYPALGEESSLSRKPYDSLHPWYYWRGLLDYHIQKSHTIPESPLFQQADLVHLHNLHGGYFNPWSLPLLTSRKPTIWTLHDMQPLTGHCAHSLECERWLPQTACGSCPRLDLYPHLYRDTTHELWLDKHTIYAHSNFYLVTPSIWLQRLTEKSLLRDFPLVCIPNGVDTRIYKPQSQVEARQHLGLPQNVILVGGCADGGGMNPFKGGQYVIQTVQALKKEFPNLVFLDIGGKTISSKALPDWIRHIPYIHDEHELAYYYAALDLLLYPSLADNHPLVCIESLCCGLPIAGFATGGVPEIVRHEQDGLLVPTHAGEELIRAATRLLRDDKLRQQMGKEAASSAARRYNLELFAQRYEKAYEEALNREFRHRKRTSLSMHAVPAVIKGSAFMAQAWKLNPPASLKERVYLIRHGLIGFICQTLCSVLGWPLQLARRVRARFCQGR